ncbi:hypothetical protein F5888DRAFT_552651 [Russula emetica]|nr:hypothetical protein F5888DRAFT_552651 [Russula emetica]
MTRSDGGQFSRRVKDSLTDLFWSASQSGHRPSQTGQTSKDGSGGSATYPTFFGQGSLTLTTLRTPTLGAHDEARLTFDGRRVQVQVRLRQSHPEPPDSDHRMVEVKFFSDRQLSALAQICTLSLRPLLTTENLYIYSVKNLYLSKRISPHFALALQELTGGRTTEVLPALRNVILVGFQSLEPFREGIALFISARQLSRISVGDSSWCGTSGRRSMIDSCPSSGLV